MDFFIRGSTKKVTLLDKDLAGVGGQANVYRKAETAFKVYHDPSTMIPVSKINELSILDNDNIIRPKDVLLDKANKIVGYTMRFVKGTYVMCELFSRDGKDRAKLANDGIVKIVQNMQATMQGIHDHKIVVADANEMNFLVSHDLTSVYFIDTDNYQTPSFPCVAIMPNIRDRHTHGFSAETDWFACGILWFNLWVGIHPFMAPHPDQKYKLPITPERFENRMQDCISAFNPQCRLPAACSSIDVIPQSYRDWMKAMFIDRKRLAPPSSLVPIIVIYRPTVTRLKGTNNFDIAVMLDLPEDIVSFYSVQGIRASVTTKAIYLGTTRVQGLLSQKQVFVAHTPKLTKIITGEVVDGAVSLFNASDNALVGSTISCDQMMSYDGRFYIKHQEQIQEITFVEMGLKVVGVTVKPVCNCMLNTTKFYDGVAIQSLKDKYFINVFPQAGMAREFVLTELNGRGRIVSAKYENRVLMIVTINSLGQYDRFVFRLSTDHSQYDLREEKNVTFTGLNFTVLDNGVCCCMNEKDEIEIFRNARGDPNIKVINDAAVTGRIRLFKDGTTVLFAQDEVLYRIKMK